MFTEGQLFFGIFFMICFIIILILSYKRDKKIHHKNYKNVKWVLIGFIIFLSILILVKNMIKN